MSAEQPDAIAVLISVIRDYGFNTVERGEDGTANVYGLCGNPDHRFVFSLGERLELSLRPDNCRCDSFDEWLRRELAERFQTAVRGKLGAGPPPAEQLPDPGGSNDGQTAAGPHQSNEEPSPQTPEPQAAAKETSPNANAAKEPNPTPQDANAKANPDVQSSALTQQEFWDAMRAAEVDPGAPPIPDGQYHRFRSPGERRDSSWYFFTGDDGYFGSWSRGIHGEWESDKPGLTKKERERQKKLAKDAADAVRKKHQAEAAKKAKYLWDKVAKPIERRDDHSYLVNKQIQPHKIRRLGVALCIPMLDFASGALVNLQTIDPVRGKRFLYGGQVSGCYFPIAGEVQHVGKKPTQLAIAEGYATAATIFETTDIPTAVAFSASNLLAVAEGIRRRYRKTQIIICADNDRETPGNPGLTKASEAAKAVDGVLVIPQFPAGVDGTDFNDLACALGKEAVAEQISRAVDRGIPSNFKLDGGVLTWLKLKFVKGKPVTEEIPICSHLEVVALTRDVKGTSWGRLLRFLDSDGTEHEWSMPMEMLAADGREYRARLLDEGLRIFSGPERRFGLHEYLTNCKPRQRARAVNRIGWHSGVFVLPDAAFGYAGGETTLYQSATAERHNFNVSGTLEDWQAHIATPATGNSRLILAISIAFAAPLLELVNAESGGFHFVGPSTLGKTTAGRVAGSVWGGSPSQQGYQRQWRATSNGLEGVAALHCDALLCLGELSEVNPREAGQIVYMLANGQGKARARRDGSARNAFEWRLLFLSTGEITLADKVREDPRQRATAGQAVRVLDIPAECGRYGLFENLHGSKNSQAFTDQLIAATQKYYGTPIRAFLTELTARRDELTEAVQNYQADILKKLCPKDAHPQVSRAAKRFALVLLC